MGFIAPAVGFGFSTSKRFGRPPAGTIPARHSVLLRSLRILLSGVYSSGGRIRTYNLAVTRAPDFHQGLDYLIP